MRNKALMIIALPGIRGGDVFVRQVSAFPVRREGAFLVFKISCFLMIEVGAFLVFNVGALLVRQRFAFPVGLISMKRTVWGARVSVKVMTPFRTSMISVTGVRRAQAL